MESSQHCQAEPPVDETLDRTAARHRRFTRIDDVLDDAQRRANAVDIGQPILDFLYEKTRWKSLVRAEWERQVREATALDENLTRFSTAPLLKRIASQIANPLKAAIVPELRAAPTLAITYHGGFSAPLRRLFGHFFPEGVAIGANGRYGARNGAFALFAAREALLNGKPVLMAPDGRFGKETAALSVLGAQLLVTDGAPFLAHLTGCHVVWLALVWTGDAFAVDTCAGPRRGCEETFTDYRARFYKFYADRLEHAFTGDPATLPLTLNWKFIFDAMLAGKTHRVRRPTWQSQG